MANWKSININTNQIKANTGKAILLAMPHNSDYDGYVYRIGQKYDVDYYNLWCNVGLEQLIQESLNKKSNLLNEVKKRNSKERG